MTQMTTKIVRLTFASVFKSFVQVVMLLRFNQLSKTYSKKF